MHFAFKNQVKDFQEFHVSDSWHEPLYALDTDHEHSETLKEDRLNSLMNFSLMLSKAKLLSYVFTYDVMRFFGRMV